MRISWYIILIMVYTLDLIQVKFGWVGVNESSIFCQFKSEVSGVGGEGVIVTNNYVVCIRARDCRYEYVKVVGRLLM